MTGIVRLDLTVDREQACHLVALLRHSDDPQMIALAAAISSLPRSEQETLVHTTDAAKDARDILDGEGFVFEPSPLEMIENASLAMCETQPSWGHRLNKVLSAIGLNFGDAESLEWGLQRDYVRLFGYHPDAIKAITDGDQSYPPMGQIIR